MFVFVHLCPLHGWDGNSKVYIPMHKRFIGLVMRRCWITSDGLLRLGETTGEKGILVYQNLRHRSPNLWFPKWKPILQRSTSSGFFKAYVLCNVRRNIEKHLFQCCLTLAWQTDKASNHDGNMLKQWIPAVITCHPSCTAMDIMGIMPFCCREHLCTFPVISVTRNNWGSSWWVGHKHSHPALWLCSDPGEWSLLCIFSLALKAQRRVCFQWAGYLACIHPKSKQIGGGKGTSFTTNPT